MSDKDKYIHGEKWALKYDNFSKRINIIYHPERQIYANLTLDLETFKEIIKSQELQSFLDDIEKD